MIVLNTNSNNNNTTNDTNNDNNLEVRVPVLFCQAALLLLRWAQPPQTFGRLRRREPEEEGAGARGGRGKETKEEQEEGGGGRMEEQEEGGAGGGRGERNEGGKPVAKSGSPFRQASGATIPHPVVEVEAIVVQEDHRRRGHREVVLLPG